jgi:GTP-binding protein
MSLYPEARFMISAADPVQFPDDAGSEVAIAGRSNAGKSSAINALLNRRSLARTSKTPGRTRLLNFFEVAPGARLIDLPGYGYAAGPREERMQWGTLIEGLAPRRSLRGLLLIVDARRGLLEGDHQLLAWAASLSWPVHVLLSKSDQLTRTDAQRVLKETVRIVQDSAGTRTHLSAQLFSAHKGSGMDEARATLEGWLGLPPRRSTTSTPLQRGQLP